MKDVQVTINQTEIKHIDFNNAFTKKPGDKIQLSVKSQASIKLNPANPVVAIVLAKVTVEDQDKCIQMEVETITGVQVNTFVDNLDEYIKENYLPIILMAANEKARAFGNMVGIPVKIPNPLFGKADKNFETVDGLTQ